MIKATTTSYSDYIHFAEHGKYGNVYPLSIAEGYQHGDIYVNSISKCRSVLFWHYSGFAFISGDYDEHFLSSVYDIISDINGVNSRRIIVISENLICRNKKSSFPRQAKKKL